MKTKREGNHTGEALMISAKGALSRVLGMLAQREAPYEDGTVLSLSGEFLVACEDATDGVTPPEGILYGNYNASKGPVKCIYIPHLAVVKDAALIYPEESTEGGEKAAVIATLEAKFITAR